LEVEEADLRSSGYATEKSIPVVPHSAIMKTGDGAGVLPVFGDKSAWIVKIKCMPKPTANEEAVFSRLARESKAAFLTRLRAAFRKMTKAQRHAVFDHDSPQRRKRIAEPPIDPRKLLRAATRFRRDSLGKKYYAPFMFDSKNFMQVPQATEIWCDQFAKLANDATKLTGRGDHAHAVRCFSILHELLEAMESGNHEIVFAHELGSWMIPADEKVWLKAYIKSLAAIATPEKFAEIVTPMLWRDSTQSFAAEVYASATQVATGEQRAALEAERRRRDVRVPGEARAR
jgi:hypothetical protein